MNKKKIYTLADLYTENELNAILKKIKSKKNITLETSPKTYFKALKESKNNFIYTTQMELYQNSNIEFKYVPKYNYVKRKHIEKNGDKFYFPYTMHYNYRIQVLYDDNTIKYITYQTNHKISNNELWDEIIETINIIEREYGKLIVSQFVEQVDIVTDWRKYYKTRKS